MGVTGLWEVLRPASKTRSLTEIAVKDGFEKNPHGVRGYRIGIDASIWFFHMEYGREGENPHLRTLFFRCATLMKAPFLPLFVFDGPKRPDFKRGKKVNKAPNKLIPSMKQIIEAFGFEHRTAPGEAEAELAYLNYIGVIDGVLSDDVDNFLFGATTVIRNPSNSLSGNRSNPVLNSAGKDDKNHSWVYEASDILSHPEIGLTRGGMILIALLSGGDYHKGLDRCGMKTAVGLAKCGMGDTLLTAAINHGPEELGRFLEVWRRELRHELMTNSRGFIGRKSPALANALENNFPDIDVLMSYVNPVTSESMGKPYRPGDIKWDREPDISALARICEFFFEWGYKESIIKRFRTVIWHSAVLRIIRRAVLDVDQGKRAIARAAAFATPSRTGRRALEPYGTPSKMIAKYFSTLGIEDRRDDEEEDRLMIKIHSTRTHVSTDGLPEYRLEIDPSQLVRLAEYGIKGTREKPTEEWADDEELDKEAKEQASNDPQEHMRLWMPACMVKIVEPGLVQDYDDEVARKAAKKANKGQGRGRKKKATEGEDGDGETTSPAKPKPRAPRAKKAIPPPPVSEDEDDDAPSPTPCPPQVASKSKATQARPSAAVPSRPAVAATTSGPKPKGKSRLAVAALSSDEDDGLDDLAMSPARLFGSMFQGQRTNTHTRMQPAPSSSGAYVEIDDSVDEVPALSPSPRRRAGVRDLTKKATTSSTNVSRNTRIFPPSASSSPEKAKQSVSTTSKATNPTPTKSIATIANGKKPARAALPAPAPAPFLTFFDDAPPSSQTPAEDTAFDSDDLYSKSFASAPPLDLDDDDNSFFASPMRATLFPRPKAAPGALSSSSRTTSASTTTSSPKSRARLHRKNSSLSQSSSDEDSQNRYLKSPKKSAAHRSPAAKQAAGSSSSSRTQVPQPHFGGGARSVSGSSNVGAGPSKKPLSKTGMAKVMKKVDLSNLPVYEISSDEDSENEVAVVSVGPKPKAKPISNPKSRLNAGAEAARTREDVPPLISARERAKAKAGGRQMQTIDFIDLT